MTTHLIQDYHQSSGSFDVQVVHQLGSSWQNVFDGADILMKHAYHYAVAIVIVYFLARTTYGVVSSLWMKYVIRRDS